MMIKECTPCAPINHTAYLLIAVRCVQKYIWNLPERATREQKFQVACKLLRAFEGEVRILDPERAHWTLVDIDGQTSATMVLQQNDQFRLTPNKSADNANQPCCGENWLTPLEVARIEFQCSAAAKRNHVPDQQDAYRPCWKRQAVQVACPTNKRTGKEWRLNCDVVTLGLV